MFKDKVVFVTGSSHGIGKETALAFAKEGAIVVVTYFTDKKNGESVMRECSQISQKPSMLVKLNVRSTGSVKSAVKEIVSKLKKIDILVNNAGVINWRKLEEQTFEQIEDQVRTNLEGLIKVTKAALPHVKDTIINVASGAGQTGYETLTTYCATKFGVRGFTQALAQEVERLNIYSVCPGMTATRMTKFRGTQPTRVAAVILNTASGKYSVKSGEDVNVWDVMED